MLEAIAKDYADKVKVVEMDVDSAREIPGEFGIMAIPTVIFFRGGKEVDRITGGTEKALRARFKALL